MELVDWAVYSSAILLILALDNCFWIPWDMNFIKWQKRWNFDNEEIKYWKSWKKTLETRYVYTIDFAWWVIRHRIIAVMTDRRDIAPSIIGGFVLALVF